MSESEIPIFTTMEIELIISEFNNELKLKSFKEFQIEDDSHVIQ